LQLRLQRRRVRRYLLDRLGLLLVGQATRVDEQPAPGDLARQGGCVVLRRRVGQRCRRRDPLTGSGQILLRLLDALDRGGATSVVVVVDPGVDEGNGTLDAVAIASANAACASAGSSAGAGDRRLGVFELVHGQRHVSRGSTTSAPSVWMSPTVAASSLNTFPYRSSAST
jgi:hypothetical protein